SINRFCSASTCLRRLATYPALGGFAEVGLIRAFGASAEDEAAPAEFPRSSLVQTLLGFLVSEPVGEVWPWEAEGGCAGDEFVPASCLSGQNAASSPATAWKAHNSAAKTASGPMRRNFCHIFA